MTPEQTLVGRIGNTSLSESPSVMTGFADLDQLLSIFVARIRQELGDFVVGVYLQGSFALGASDEWSDVDFVVAVKEPILDLACLNELHAELYEMPTEWAKHLEGSYIPVPLLRRVDPARTPVPFLDNGATTLKLDAHCNSAVVRWILHRHGIPLSGPPSASLVDPVSKDDLRREAADALQEYLDWGAGLTRMSAWAQPYLILTICRLLQTIERGDVATKAAAAAWAAKRLPMWASLIERASNDRPDPWRRVHEAADPKTAAATRAFLREIARGTRHARRPSPGAVLRNDP